jgi:hypothetical protein
MKTYKILEIDDKLDNIYTNYIERLILDTSYLDYTDGELKISDTNVQFGVIYARGNEYFVTENVFTVFSRGAFGECVPGKKIQFFESMRPTNCFMTMRGNEIQNYCNSIRSLNRLSLTNKNIQVQPRFYLNGQNFTNDNINCSVHFPYEINFEIETINSNEIENVIALINFRDTPGNSSIFSVTFKNKNTEDEENENENKNENEKENEKLSGTLISGKGSYLFGFPLMIKYILLDSTEYEMYKYGFVMNGKFENGQCKTGSERESEFQTSIENDDPIILFGEDISYSCNFRISDVEGDYLQFFYRTYLVRKAYYIQYIGKYGSSLRNNNDWIKVENCMFDEKLLENKTNETTNIKFNRDYFQNYTNNCSIKPEINCNEDDIPFPNKIILNINVKNDNSRNIVTNAYYVFNFTCIDTNIDVPYELTFQTRYHYQENNKNNNNILFKNPDKPFILPRLPKDIIDPIKNVNVNN